MVIVYDTFHDTIDTFQVIMSTVN